MNTTSSWKSKRKNQVSNCHHRRISKTVLNSKSDKYNQAK